MDYPKRRSFFKKFLLGIAALSSYSLPGWSRIFPSKKHVLHPGATDPLAGVNDRVWIGKDYWAVPMEDWAVKDGRIEFYGVHKNSRVNVLTSVLQEGNGAFTLSAEMGLMKAGGKAEPGSAGFGLGVTDELDADVKSGCYFGYGINAGISTDGSLFIGREKKALPQAFNYDAFHLVVEGRRQNGSTEITLVCRGEDGAETKLTHTGTDDISGLVTLVNNIQDKEGAPFWFRNFQISGTKISAKPENTFGPILWSMYTLSKGTLKLTAQMPPLGRKDSDQVELHLKRNGAWKLSATAKIDPASCTAIFQLNDWNAAAEVPYEVVYKNSGETYKYAGTIRQEPLGRPLRFGGLTCQHAAGFPYSPLVTNLKKHDPDILFFSGDQLYEGNGGYPIKRTPIDASILSYLGKWYMFGWAFGDVMRDRPTICTPDDHDVFHGNLWGEGGELISLEEWERTRDAHGGYVQSPEMVNVVATTQCGHLPDPYDNKPLNSGIKTWYTELVYSNVSFAIISDRMFKSGPDHVRDIVGRKDHIKEPLPKDALEDPNLELLGEGQMRFLNEWIQDWKGATMKVLLSQTLFSNAATHHGNDKMFLYGDMDSGGWPRKKRDEVVRLIRKGAAFHINGDQHLPFIVQYSVDAARDAGWTFCTPAISTGYIRWAEPDGLNIPVKDRPAHGLPNTGLYQDIFGNANYVYAVGNPKDDHMDQNRYIHAQNKSSGFGVITFDTDARTIKMEAWRFLADKDKPSQGDQFPGWPMTITQADNDGRQATGYLPALKINKPNQVVKLINEKSGELVSILRTKGSSYQPKTFEDGTYTLVVGEGAGAREIKGLKPKTKIPKKAIEVSV